MVDPLPAERYRRSCDPSRINVCNTSEMNPLEEIIGQERALRAMKFGLEIKDHGFNVYISGVPGTGRKTAVIDFLGDLSKKKPRANDWCYVNNFENSYEPNAISLPPGKGKEFAEDMSNLIDEARKTLPKVFESEYYATKKESTVKSIEQQKSKLFNQINASAQQKGFVIQSSPVGLVTIPIVDGHPLHDEEFMALPQSSKDDIQQRREKLNEELRSAFRQLKELETKGSEGVKKLNREISLNAISSLLTALREKYKDLPQVIQYIDNVQDDLMENLDVFVGAGDAQQQQLSTQIPLPFLKELPFKKYEVNVFVDNGSVEGAPVVMDQNPTYPNLLGRTEREIQLGMVTTDFTMIRPGSIHKANGGYLVIPIEDLLRNPYSWEGLKISLKTEQVIVEEPAEKMGYITARVIKPAPIPLDIKVVLIGTPDIYTLLYMLDPDFKELFKVRADFDTTMDRTAENALKYGSFICTLCEEFGFKHLDSSAVAKIVEYGSRLAEDQTKLSTRFSDVADIIHEANFYANQEEGSYITSKHILKAIEEKIYRSNLVQQKIQEYMERNIYLIDTAGAKVGQVNGLSVIELGDFMFGRPSRVTASVAVGREGIIDIERESAMGGPIHTKGVMILSGYLANKYAQDKPLALSARLVFEQSYEGVEGDSASSTELYAILSALSGIPLKQSLAVTGSVNQKGDVQAIGGVNEKLEGFFELCKATGFTGEQGAIIPASNAQNLMLKEEMVDAAKAGKFRVFPVKTIDEGIEVLTGVKAGSLQPDGTYPEGTVNYLVNDKLRTMAERIREFQVFK